MMDLLLPTSSRWSYKTVKNPILPFYSQNGPPFCSRRVGLCFCCPFFSFAWVTCRPLTRRIGAYHSYASGSRCWASPWALERHINETRQWQETSMEVSAARRYTRALPGVEYLSISWCKSKISRKLVVILCIEDSFSGFLVTVLPPQRRLSTRFKKASWSVTCLSSPFAADWFSQGLIWEMTSRSLSPTPHIWLMAIWLPIYSALEERAQRLAQILLSQP